MKSLYRKWVIGPLILLLVLVAVDIHFRVMQQPNQRPCLAIPTKFILQEPECAGKLLRAANISNVRILLPGALDSGTSRE